MSRARDIADLGNEASGGLTSSDISDLNDNITPHIIPGVLYPAVDGKDINGTALSSYTYGDLHTATGVKYYYTNIKGSKPIKDPRIGGHFGSQRHKFKSLQLLEQETATEGKDVYSVDGRNWVRAVGNFTIGNNAYGHRPRMTDTASFYEITGYFNNINFLVYTHSSSNVRYSLDGATEVGTDYGSTSVGSPLINRYVDSASVVNLPITPSLGIHTIKIRSNASNNDLFGIELIAQDTTSTANRSKIQIPSQDVVSYGKKFTVSAEGSSGHHYDPFNGFTSGSSVSSYVDTDTSLGLEKWKNSSTYYRPYNGGRVVKWVDSSGVIKTSVTMMPPNAQTTFGVAKDEKGDDSAGNTSASVANDNYKPTISDQSVDFSLLEKATSLHYREFGNGSANGGTGATYADASMLNTSDNIAYVMDDGLTSVSAYQAFISSGYFERSGANHFFYLTFIGTGCSWNSNATKSQITNLPYGTHVLKGERTGSSPNFSNWTIDGQEFTNPTNGYYAVIRDFFDIHQPKRPPIPEDACVIADYMLMADYVGVPASDSGQHSSIPKGTRMCSSSRDAFYDTASGTLLYAQNDLGSRERTVRVQYNDISSGTKEGPVITYFGHPKMSYGLASDTDASPRYELKINDSTTNVTGVSTSGSVSGSEITGFTVSGYSYQHISSTKSDGTLGANTAKISAYPADSSDNHLYLGDAYIPTPIHTSFHYQTFETPFLHELNGGDRNMEQTNLVCSPDGRSWDSLTRDTSYLGYNCIMTTTDSGSTSASSTQVFDEWRGEFATGHPAYNKDFAIAYDRVICLKDGFYHIHAQTIKAGAGDADTVVILINGNEVLRGHASGSNRDTPNTTIVKHLKRGDFVQIKGLWYGSFPYSQFFISRVN